tara:strand:- start:213 stop:1301 length:1089 start_codon:yes stop_codon:yes gene_type:complete
MDSLPEELFDNILIYLKDLDPISLYKLRFTNKLFYKKINEIKNNYNKNYIIENISLQNNINTLCYKGDFSIFKWLLKNNIVLTENNVINVVNNNRKDILKECFKYNEILNIIFNDKYDILIFVNERLIKTESPLIIAAYNNNFDIIKLLLEINILNNPFHKQIDILLESLIIKNHKSIITYIFVYHFEKIDNINYIIDNFIKNLINVDDIIYYLIQSKKIKINNALILNCIDKGYNELCKYLYNNIDINVNIYEEHLLRIIKKDNNDLFDFFFKKYPCCIVSFKKLLKEINISYNFFQNIFTNYLPFFDKDFPIIDLCLKYNYSFNSIKYLVYDNFNITKETIQLSLENDDKRILKILVNKY